MRHHHGFSGALAGVAVLASAGAARAEAGETLALAVAQRPLTLPRLTFAPTLDLNQLADKAKSGSKPSLNLDVSARFGVLDDFEISAVVLPLQLSPSVAYNSPRFEATFRLLKGVIELGARLDATLLRQDQTQGVALETGIPALIHLGDAGRIDLGIFVPMDFKTEMRVEHTTAIGLRAPIQILYNVLPTFYLGASTGVGTEHVSYAGRELVVPLGILGGYSITSAQHAFVDVNGYLTFPNLVRGDTVNPRDFNTGVSATMFFYF